MDPNICHLDIETYSEAPLKKCGVYVYARHPSTEILVVCYAFGDGPVNVWVPLEELPRSLMRELRKGLDEGAELYIQRDCPFDLADHAEAGGEFRAHNSQFERTLLNEHPGKDIGFPATTIEQWVCTAAKMAAHSLPRHLEGAANALETHRKDAVGKSDMMALCKPRTGKVKRYTVESDPKRYLSMYLYCADDVRAERGIDEEVDDLSSREIKVFEMDQRINDRGIHVDMNAVADAQVLIDQHKADLTQLCVKWTGGIRPTQTRALADWIRENGYDIENLQAPTVREAMKDPNCPKQIRRVLQLTTIYAMKAVSKYTAIENAISTEDRLYGMFLYHGAGTGRWSSLIVQLQNLFRPVIKDADTAIDLMSLRDLAFLKVMYDMDPMKVIASCIRGMLIASEGHELMAMDFAAIEARVIAWLAGEEGILEVFRTHGKVYEYTAAKIFHKKMEDVTERERFIGKIAVLALGYQGGKSAFAKMAKQYGVEIPEEFAEEIKVKWREANQKIVKMWYELEEVAVAAIRFPGKTFALKSRKIFMKVEGKFLYIKLPSGRKLAYFKPELDQEGKPTYMGIDTYTRKWQRCKTYGGKLAENIVQAIARDLLVNGMFNIEAHGLYKLLGTVHDEVITEVEVGKGSKEELASLLCRLPKWAKGLPVKAAGFSARRYRK